MTMHRHDRVPRHASFAALLCLSLSWAGCGEAERPERDRETAREQATRDDPGEAGFAEYQGAGREGAGQQPAARVGAQLGQDAVAVSIEAEEGAEVRVGEAYDYRIVVQNTSDHSVHGVRVHNYLPEAFELYGSEPQPDEVAPVSGQGIAAQQGQQPRSGEQPRSPQDQAPGQPARGQQQGQQQQGEAQQPAGPPMMANWYLGKLEAGESRQIAVRGVAGREGELHSCVTVEYEPAVCATFTAVKPQLRLARTVPEQPVYRCDPIPVTYALTNEGTGASAAVMVEEQLPEGFQTADGAPSVQWQVPPIEPGQTVEQRFELAAAQPGEWRGRATARGENVEVHSNEAAVVVLEPSLELRVDAPQQQYVDRAVGYRITVANTSDAPALDTVVQWTPPESARNVTVTGAEMQRQDTFVLGRLQPQESRQIEVAFQSGQPGQVQATFVARAHCAEERQQAVTTELVGIPAVRLEAIDLVDPVAVDDVTAYEIRVTNQGTAESLGLAVRAELPPELQFRSAEGSTEVREEGGQLVFGPIDALPPGEMATWRVLATATQPGQVRFRVELTSDATTQPVQEIEPTTVF